MARDVTKQPLGASAALDVPVVLYHAVRADTVTEFSPTALRDERLNAFPVTLGVSNAFAMPAESEAVLATFGLLRVPSPAQQ